MSYSTNPYAPKARGDAMRNLILDKQPVGMVAKKFGIHRTTIWRWYRKWRTQNQHIDVNQQAKCREVSIGKFRQSSCKWSIPTQSSAPHTHPTRLAGTIEKRILEIRRANQRCAEVIWYQLQQEGIKISLSSVGRILARNHAIRHWSKWKKRHASIPRPRADVPGALVEVDTVHYVNALTRQKLYITTVIDLYTRMAYAKASAKIQPSVAAQAILEAEAQFGFRFSLVQSDNGPEFSKEFTEQLQKCGIKHRHTRVRKPNDNAHIERFNRTLREECIGYHWSSRLSSGALAKRLQQYLDYYNHNRIHLGLQCRTPIQMLQR